MTITARDVPRTEQQALPATRPDGNSGASGGHPEAVRRHITALDGMRGIAVLLVMFFHFRLGPFRGGFVGVTVFFTLSGFLICSRTLSEVGRKGSFAVADFFERRVRRLAPAAIVCILGVVIATSIFGTHEQHASVPGDAIAALANVANWRFLVHGTSYADLFAAPSPLNHFWSLAIEEQFYLVFPVVVFLALRLPRRIRVAVIALVVSAALEWSAHEATVASSFNRFYYGTDARMSELLVGVIAALALYYWRISVPRPAGLQRFGVMLLAAAGLATVVVGAMTYRNGGASYQHGGAFLIALATAALIIGALEGSNGIARLCSVRPLVYVGKISYGAYLYHWPIFALSGKHWGPLHGTWLGLAQLASSLLLAAVSFRYLEAPIQRRRFAPTRRAMLRGWTTALAGAACITLALGVFNPARGPSRFAGASTGLQIPAAVKAKPGTVVARTNAADRPLRVLVTGDSTSEVIANALTTFQNAHPQALQVLNKSLPGCPITPTDLIRNYSGESGQNVALCKYWEKTFPAEIAKFKPDVSLVFLSVMEETDQRTVNGNWDNLLDPAYRAQQESAYDTLISELTATGAPVAWADAPYFKFQLDLPWISDAPERTDVLNSMFRDVVARHPNVRLLDYASHLNKPGGLVNTVIRPDGIHMTPAYAEGLDRVWLLPLLDKYYSPHPKTCGTTTSLPCGNAQP
ncbi:MAG TPA: acyltransferase family protein [Frankiaceae bacterium]|nr:acyltransferase family protein [Frankiaceae bacterium]